MTHSWELRSIATLWVIYGAYVVWLGLAHDTPLSLVVGPTYAAVGVGVMFEKRWAMWLLLCLAALTIASVFYVVTSISGLHAIGSAETNVMIVSLLPGLLLMLVMVFSAILAIQHLRTLRR